VVGFVNQAQEVDRAILDLIVDVKRKGSAMPAREPVRTHMIATLQPDDGSHRVFHTLVKITTESV